MCCAFTGTFLLMWTISLTLPGSFKHILPNTMLSLTSQAYLAADMYSPFSINGKLCRNILGVTQRRM